MKTLLHVGCGSMDKSALRGFSSPDWREIRFDIDAAAKPDIIGTLTDMGKVESGSVDAVFSSHNIEHLYPHEVPVALREFARVLKPGGFALITCPDLQTVAAFVAQGNLTEPLYVSPAGPIAPLDIMFGHSASIARGNAFMAHRTGFTEASLLAQLQDAGFPLVLSLRRPQNFDLWVMAWKQVLPEEEARRQGAEFLPEAPNAENVALQAYHLNEERKYPEAMAAANAALAIDPKNLRALCALTFALLMLDRHEECIARCDAALLHYPGRPELMLNRAAALAGLIRNEEALAYYEEVLALYPDNARALYCSALMLERMGKTAMATPRLKRAVEIDPGEPWALGASLTGRLRMFDWDGLDKLLADIRDGIASGKPVVEPFRLLLVCGDPQLLLDASKVYVAAKAVPLQGISTPLPNGRRGGKIRVGYFSSDFRDHPVLDLIAETLRLHDRDQFEIHAFSFLTGGGDAQERARAAVDVFHDVNSLDPRALVEYARAQELDIAVDLNGHTFGAKPAAFATRMAPVQIQWLGYPGTTGASYIDYVLADDTVLPPEHRRFFTEKVLSLPHCFQPNDTGRAMSDEKVTRAEFGLPEKGFVYCSFNTPAKLMPHMFDVWASILKAVAGSVLWIFDGGVEEGRGNLLREASARGIDAGRIVFAERLERPRHLARHALADLFLDTTPFNAGATAACAVWTGLPILTFPGDTFASRYGASILKAAGLEEMIMPDIAAYQAKAIELGRNPGRARALRKKLVASRKTAPLFDIPRFVRGLEEAYRRTVERSRAGQPPDHIAVRDEEAVETA